jgi:hypothetical protein
MKRAVKGSYIDKHLKYKIMTSIIKQSSSFYNPYYFNGVKIHHVKFFNSDGVIGSTNWFTKSGSNNDYKECEFPFKITKKLKVDFDLKHGFIVKSKDKFSDNDYNLFLPIDMFIHSLEKDIIHRQNSMETQTLDLLKITIRSKMQDLKLDENKKAIWFYTEFQDNEIRVEMNRKFTPTPKKKKFQKLADDINKITVGEITFYDIQRILQDYKITKIRK